MAAVAWRAKLFFTARAAIIHATPAYDAVAQLEICDGRAPLYDFTNHFMAQVDAFVRRQGNGRDIEPRIDKYLV
jgi:hypothetical protein